MKSTEDFMSTIGCHHKYQIILSIIYLVIGTFIDFSLTNLSFMTTLPIVKYQKGDIIIKETINSEICEHYKNNYDIVYSESLSNWLIDLNLECKPTLVSMLTSAFLFGNLLGLVALQFLKDISKEKLIKAFATIYVTVTVLIFFKSFYTIFLFNVVQGFCQLSLMVLRNSLITELICKKYRSLFIFIQILSSITAGLFLSLVITLGLEWKLQYVTASSFVLIFNVFNFIYIVTNPRYLLINNEPDLATHAANYIRKINNKEGETIDDNLSESEYENEILKPQKISCQNESNDNGTNSNKQDKLEKFTVKRTSKLEEFIDPDKSILIQPESVKESHGYEQEPSLYLRFNLLILFITCSINFIFVIYEAKDFNSTPNIELFVLISALICIPIFLLISILANTKLLGRKYTLAIIQIVNIILRLLYICFGISNTYIFFIIRIFISASQLPQHTLISESFSNKGRVKHYSLLNIIVKVFAIAVPGAYDNISYLVYNIISTLLSTICLVYLVFFLEETRGKELKDY